MNCTLYLPHLHTCASKLHVGAVRILAGLLLTLLIQAGAFVPAQAQAPTPATDGGSPAIPGAHRNGLYVGAYPDTPALRAAYADSLSYHPDRVAGPWPWAYLSFDLDSAIDAAVESFLADYTRSLLPDTQRCILLFAGDLMGHEAQIGSAWDEVWNDYRYRHTFDYVRASVQSADLAIANLEVTLAGSPYSGYPQFSSPDALAEGARDAGFDVLATANNHSCDRGRRGVERTIRVLDSLGIAHTGTFVDAAQRDSSPALILESRGLRIALLNYTYGTNGIEPTPPNLVNYLDTTQMAADLIRVSALAPDATIVFVHWGKEYSHEPNAYQRGLRDFLYAKGVDLVVGAHPHVLQPMHWERDTVTDRDRFTAWSLGNYVSNQRAYPKDGGAMLRLTLAKVDGQTRLESAGYELTWVYRPELAGKERFYILPVADFETRPDFFNSPEEYTKMMRYAEGMRDLLDRENRGVQELRRAPAQASDLR